MARDAVTFSGMRQFPANDSALTGIGTCAGGRPLSDMIWNSNTGHWACCGYNSTTKSPDCSDPSGEIYPAPAPDQLATIQYLPIHGSPTYATGASTASATGTGTGTSTAMPTGNSPAASSSGLGAGAAAGIGVGVGAGVVIIAAVIALWFWRKRKPAQPQLIPTPFGYNGIPSPAVQPNNMQPAWTYPPPEQYQVQELGKTEPGPRELDSRAK